MPLGCKTPREESPWNLVANQWVEAQVLSGARAAEGQRQDEVQTVRGKGSLEARK